MADVDDAAVAEPEDRQRPERADKRPARKTGAVLISTTQMMPQLLQADFGYTALLAAGDHGVL